MDVPSREFDVGAFNLHLKWFLFVVLTLGFSYHHFVVLINVKERPTEAKKYRLNETGKHLFTLLLRRRVEEALATCNYPGKISTALGLTSFVFYCTL